MSKLVVEMTADETKLFASMQKLIRKQADVEKGFKKIGKTQKKAASDGEKATKRTTQALKRTTRALKDQQRANQNLLSSVKSLAGGYLGIQAATRLATAAMREHQEFKEKASLTQLEIAPARAAAARNFTGTPAEFEAFEKSIAKISINTGVPQAALFASASSALSSLGSLPRSKALESVELAARLVPDSPEQIPTIAGGILDLLKVDSSKDKDPRNALGFITALAKVSRVVTPQLLSKNVTLGISGIVQLGGTIREGGAVNAGLSQILNDEEGRRSATASIAMARQLLAFLPTNDVTDSEGKLLRKGTGFTNLFQRITAVQDDPKLFKQLLESGFTIPGKSEPAVLSLLSDRNSPAAREVNSAFERLPDLADAGSIVDAKIALIESGPIAAHSRLERTLEAQIAAQKALDIEGADEGLIRSKLSEVSEIIGNNFFGRLINRAKFEFKVFDDKSPRQALIDIIESDIRLTESGGEVTEKESRQIEALNAILAELKNMGGAGLRQGITNAQAQLNANDE